MRAAVMLAMFCIAGVAVAQPAETHLELGIQQLDEGMLEEALGELNRSFESDPLDREGLIRLFVHRALVLSGLGRDAEVDLQRLASLGPTREQLRRLPPPLRSVVDEGLQDPGPMSVVVESDASAGSVSLRLRVRGDVGALVQSFRVRARVRGGSWIEGDQDLTLPTTDEREVEYVAEALGPRAIVLVSDGTEATPTALVTATPIASVAESSDLGVAPPPRRSRAGLWVGVTLLVVALAAGATVTAIVLTNRDPSDTQVGMPMVEFP